MRPASSLSCSDSNGKRAKFGHFWRLQNRDFQLCITIYITLSTELCILQGAKSSIQVIHMIYEVCVDHNNPHCLQRPLTAVNPQCYYRKEMATQLFHELDRDQSGTLDLSEFLLMARDGEHAEQLRPMFQYVDGWGDRDGKISLEEWLSQQANFQHMDDENYVAMQTKVREAVVAKESPPAAAAEEVEPATATATEATEVS